MSKNSAKKWRSSIYQRKESDTLTNEYFDRTISKFLLQMIKPEIISLSILILLHKDCSLLCAYIFLIFFFLKKKRSLTVILLTPPHMLGQLLLGSRHP